MTMEYIKFNPHEEKEFTGYFFTYRISLHAEQFSKYDTNGLRIDVFNNEFKTTHIVPYGSVVEPHHFQSQNLPLRIIVAGKQIKVKNDSGYEILLCVDDITIKSLKPSNE